MFERVRRFDPDLARPWTLGVIAGVWLAVTALVVITGASRPMVTVVHWANGHPADTPLLPTFAERFNAEGRMTPAGARIKIDVRLVNSSVTTRELLNRVRTGISERPEPNPTLITPVARYWLADINHSAGREVIDVGATRDLARTWVGIATLRDMAVCLGWPNRDIGYGEIVELASDPQGWQRYPACAKPEWGRQPLLAATDPNRSTTGRSVLLTLYSIAAGKPPERLTGADVAAERVREYLATFQRSVAHYVPDTILLNCEIYRGPRYGHFFFIAEDNLVKLYKGHHLATDRELESLFPCRQAVGPLQHRMVMLYPREGSTEHTHPAALVRADWVSPEQQQAAGQWVDFLLEEAQQRTFMEFGFRPAAGPSRGCPICGDNGIDPAGPKTVIDPSTADPGVRVQMVDSWPDIKKPGILVFVLDTSVSMAGAKVQAARDGIVRALNEGYRHNLVGLATVSTAVQTCGEPSADKFVVTDCLARVQAGGNSALYDGIAQAIGMADRARVSTGPASPVGPDTAIRGVVVLSAGAANAGRPLHELVEMKSRDGRPIRSCGGFSGGQCVDDTGRSVDMKDVEGVRLAVPTANATHVYFIGIGETADHEVGRVLSEATGSIFVGTKVEDLAVVIRTFAGYF